MYSFDGDLFLNEEEFKEFDSYFKPQSVALIGVSKKNDYFWLQNFVLAGFLGKVFPINPKGPNAAYGIPFYKSILDISEPIDYAVITVPAPRVPQVLKECIEKKAKLVTIFTSGFSETGKNECTLLENKLISILNNQKNNPPLRVIGPNCMGIYCPESKVSFRQDLSLRVGNIGFIAQSGGLAQNLAYKLKDLGIGISKFISYGNQIDLTCTDFLEYLTHDKKTKIICAYIEGVRKKDSPRFFKILREASLKKPVILWKGGVTDAGAKAAFTHTGALSGSIDIWNAAVKQAGIIKVNNFREFVNCIITFKHYKPSNLALNNINKDVVLLSISGGSSVTNTDDVMKVGLNVPKFSPETIKKIEDIMIYTIGVNSTNPLDLAYDFFNFSGIKNIFDVLIDLPISSIIFEISLQYIYFPRLDFFGVESMKDIYYQNLFKNLSRLKKAGKLVAVAVIDVCYPHERVDDTKLFLKKFPAYGSVEDAARALKYLIDYTHFLEKHQESNKKLGD